MADPPPKQYVTSTLFRKAAETSTLAVVPRDETAENTRMVARGEGALAEQILSLAFSHDVKIRQDTMFAEILMALEPESEIPPLALTVVAEILNRLYQAEKQCGSDSLNPAAKK